MGKVASIAQEIWTTGIARRALVVSLVVGTTLNLINQGEAILGGGTVHWGKAALTYVVPLVVSTHGALTARRR
jgi:hypothetical protein